MLTEINYVQPIASLINHLTRLLLAYAALTPFVRVTYLPYLDAKLQPTEIVFVLLFPLALWAYGKKLWLQQGWLMWALVIYVFTNLVSALVAGEVPALLEAFGRFYLVLLALVVAVWVGEDREDRPRKVMDAILYGTIALAICSYVAYFAALLGHHNSLVHIYGNYPYLGTLFRASGFTGGPGMLIIVLLLPILYAWRSWRDGERSWAWFACLLPLAGLTFSKEILLLGLGLLLVDPWFRGRGRTLLSLSKYRMQGWLIGAVAVVFWFGTHFIVQQRQPVAESSLAGTEYTSGNLIWVGAQYQLLETSYTALKRAGVSVSRQHPIFGVGPGQFSKHLPAEQEAGVYPAHLPHYDPHSTWLGALSETGIVGLLALLLLSALLYYHIRRSPPADAAAGVVLCLQTFLVLLLILSISKDVANFRFVWVVLGVLLGLARGTRQLS